VNRSRSCVCRDDMDGELKLLSTGVGGFRAVRHDSSYRTQSAM